MFVKFVHIPVIVLKAQQNPTILVCNFLILGSLKPLMIHIYLLNFHSVGPKFNNCLEVVTYRKIVNFCSPMWLIVELNSPIASPCLLLPPYTQSTTITSMYQCNSAALQLERTNNTFLTIKKGEETSLRGITIFILFIFF